MTERPAYADLPGGDASGLFGAGDALGALNLQTPSAIAHAATLVREGAVFSLNAPVDWVDPPLFSRKQVEHHVFTTPRGNLDDWLDGYYLQASSQWDGFLHARRPDGGFHNRLPAADHGVHVWAARGIAGRAVLLDIGAFLADQGRPLDWRTRAEITAADLEACRAACGVEQRPGDILLIRTGWATEYERALASERAAVREDTTGPGLAADEALLAYLWDWGISALACDNIAVEALPLGEAALHPRLIGLLGVPLGELWWLDELAAHCARDGRYECLLTSAPINLRGGVGSPANAIALK
ncbi:cyclase family protein [Amycolatopsis sp. DSM 110486]|uniref:cyclase family protein n=1 Tax=Amycolatopsis sp. DSM 110486 TaxID=2865832 RepID=UPI001C6A0B75|nr:cyclase family protein [Amycolatopsis sp. DSM 110486]QYN18112.1 cyclase family protein [Amycolatopsis sp. DSM 110486]